MMLLGKSILLTGAAGGIGRATAIALLREGANVALVDRDLQQLEAVVRELETDRPGALLCLAADVRELDEVNRAVDEAAARFGRLDGAVNNAGIQLPPRPFDSYPMELFREVLAVNLLGTSYCLQAEIRAILASGGPASIVNVASGAGLVGIPGIAPYVASKSAILGLTRAAAVEYGSRGIRVNAISPGLIETPMTAADVADPAARAAMVAAHPVGRLGRPEEIAESLAWLLSDGSSYLLGANLVIDGGYTAQ